MIISTGMATLPEIVREHEVKAPTLIIVGHVVSLHHKLSWFRPQASEDGS